MAMMSMQWTEYEYMPRDLELYGTYYLPCIAKISQGYCGYGEDFFTFSSNEVYRIEWLDTQSRVVVKAATKCFYSIPVAYPLKFKVLTPKRFGTEPMYLEEILANCDNLKKETLTITPEYSEKLKFWNGADKHSTVKMDVLQVMSTYEDKYFVANAINGGQVWDATIIPVFLDIKVRVAEAAETGGTEALTEFMDWTAECVGDRNSNVTGNKEIMVFNSDAIDGKSYNYVEPSTYVSCNEVTDLRPDVIYESPVRVDNAKYNEGSTSEYTGVAHTPQYSSSVPKLLDVFLPDDVPASEDPNDLYSEIGPELAHACHGDNSTTAVHSSQAVSPTSSDTMPHTSSDTVLLPTKIDTPKGVRKLASQLNRQISLGSPVLGRRTATPPPQLPKRGSSLRMPSKRDLPDIPKHNAPQPPKFADAKPFTMVKPLNFSNERSPEQQSDAHAAATAAASETVEYLTSPPKTKPGKKEKVYNTLRDVPKSVKKMSKMEVADCLRLMHLERYSELFLQKDVDGMLLIDLDVDTLMSEFGMSKFEAIKVHKFAKDGWRPN